MTKQWLKRLSLEQKSARFKEESNPSRFPSAFVPSPTISIFCRHLSLILFLSAACSSLADCQSSIVFSVWRRSHFHALDGICSIHDGSLTANQWLVEQGPSKADGGHRATAAAKVFLRLPFTHGKATARLVLRMAAMTNHLKW